MYTSIYTYVHTYTHFLKASQIIWVARVATNWLRTSYSASNHLTSEIQLPCRFIGRSYFPYFLYYLTSENEIVLWRVILPQISLFISSWPKYRINRLSDQAPTLSTLSPARFIQSIRFSFQLTNTKYLLFKFLSVNAPLYYLKACLGGRPSRWQHRSFPTSVSLTRRPASSYLQTRHHCKESQNPGVRLKHILDHTDWEEPHSK